MLTPNSKIKAFLFKQFISVHFLVYYRFSTSRNLNSICCYSAISKTTKLTNEKNLSKILSMNAFQLFGLENKFLIDKKNLDSSYKELMKKLHPDVNSIIDEGISSHIIQQYNVVNDPFERALLLISLKSRMSRDHLLNVMDTIPLNSTLLEQIFEIDDKIENNSNFGFNNKYYDEILIKNKIKIKDSVKSLGNEFEKDNICITNVLGILKELRIYQKLNDRVSSKLDN